MSDHKNQAKRRGPMGGHGPGPGGPVEKAKDRKGTFKKLLTYIGKYKIGIAFVIAFAIASTIFAVVGPKILGKATTEIFRGMSSKLQGGAGIDFSYIGKVLAFMVRSEERRVGKEG